MESKWQLILHEKCEDPYYEITNGPISLIANCGFVGEDDADEDNIFNRVKDELNISGIDFHSGNKLELKQHLEIQELKYKMDELVQENEQLRRWKAEALILLSLVDAYADKHPEIKLGRGKVEFTIAMAKERDKLKWENDRLKIALENVYNIHSDQWTEYDRKVIKDLIKKEGESNTPALISQDAHEKEVIMQAFSKVRQIFEGREWIMEGRGSYPYNDDRYQEEVRHMYDEFDQLYKDTWHNIKSKSIEYREWIINEYLHKDHPAIHDILTRLGYKRSIDSNTPAPVQGEKDIFIFHNNSDAFRDWVTEIKGYTILLLGHDTGVTLPGDVTKEKFASEWNEYEKANNPSKQ